MSASRFVLVESVVSETGRRLVPLRDVAGMLEHSDDTGRWWLVRTKDGAQYRAAPEAIAALGVLEQGVAA